MLAGHIVDDLGAERDAGPARAGEERARDLAVVLVPAVGQEQVAVDHGEGVDAAGGRDGDPGAVGTEQEGVPVGRDLVAVAAAHHQVAHPVAVDVAERVAAGGAERRHLVEPPGIAGPPRVRALHQVPVVVPGDEQIRRLGEQRGDLRPLAGRRRDHLLDQRVPLEPVERDARARVRVRPVATPAGGDLAASVAVEVGHQQRLRRARHRQRRPLAAGSIEQAQPPGVRHRDLAAPIAVDVADRGAQRGADIRQPARPRPLALACAQDEREEDTPHGQRRGGVRRGPSLSFFGAPSAGGRPGERRAAASLAAIARRAQARRRRLSARSEAGTVQ